jgi:predicted transcriptional regulator
MPEPEATATPQLSLEAVETSILERLTGQDQQRPLSVDEIALDYDDNDIAVHDALRSLQADGLIHRCHQFVFATRAAARAAQLRW